MKRGEVLGKLKDKIKNFPVLITKHDSFLLCIKSKNFEEKLENIFKNDTLKIFSHFAFCPIFKKLTKKLFYKLFLNCVESKIVYKNEKVIKEDFIVNDLYFIREGEFVIKIKKSIFEISEIIKKLSNNKNKINEFEKYEGKKFFILLKDYDKFDEFMKKKIEYKVNFIK